MPCLERPRLTVLFVTYNHAAYIRRAVEGVLMQSSSCRFEVIVADDKSTDDTCEIIDRLFAEYPDAPPIRYLDREVNRGITENYRRSFETCDTEFVAIIEGDDYWIDPNKLARQVAFLDEHRECGAVSANYFVYDENACTFNARAAVNSEFSYIDARGLINDNLIGNFSTCLYRVAAVKAIPKVMWSGTVYDWGVNICVARTALIGFLHTPLSVYRVHNTGTWNRLSQNDRIVTQMNIIEHYNKSTDFVFDAEFESLSRRLELLVVLTGGKRPLRRRIAAILIACIPPGILWVLKLAVGAAKQFLLPPIIPIFIKKLRKGRS